MKTKKTKTYFYTYIGDYAAYSGLIEVERRGRWVTVDPYDMDPIKLAAVLAAFDKLAGGKEIEPGEFVTIGDVTYRTR